MSTPPPTHAPATATPAQAHARAPGDLLVDVREDDEWAAGHAPGAVHMALGRLDAGPLRDAATVYLVCRSGARSGRATDALRSVGVDAVNVGGGMIAWVEAGLPVVTGP